ncbi:MAG: LD-carboxypeptidase [Butyrivibrio sp.]|nr:LD-carboxypeptidase [Acetatifactor muris]MCM1560591.1 LD-carboxypeptidase [Butyrivibrio sp.]
MRYPKNLPAGGTIGFLAPSFGCATEPYRTAFDCALKNWKEQGYGILLGPNCYEEAGVGISNTPEKCGREVMELFASRADCLISCGGGELMCEILPYVDFDRLAALEPKWFMGYSDNTNLTYTLATLTDTASVYGPCASTFGMDPLHESVRDAFGVLTGEVRRVSSYGTWEKESLKGEENPRAPYNLTEPLKIRSFQGDREITGDVGSTEELRFSGRLLGGCLDCLVNLLGTRFDRTEAFVEKYREDGIIWFLEACDLNVFGVRRALWQMEEAGWLKHVKGFLIGRPANGETIMNLDQYEAVLQVAGRKNVPVLMDVDLGHRPPMMPLVVGSMAEVTAAGNKVCVESKLT